MGSKFFSERETFLFNLKPIFYDKKVQNKLTNLIPEQSLYMLKDKLDQINKISEESDNEIGSLDLINLKENKPARIIGQHRNIIWQLHFSPNSKYYSCSKFIRGLRIVKTENICSSKK